MAEPKRHMDVPKERVLEGSTHTPAGTKVGRGRATKLKLRSNPDSEDNHHNCR